MWKTLMPGDEETMSDEAIWKTLPVKMSGSFDLKRKRSTEDDYRRMPEEGFKKGKAETKEYYKAILHMVKDQIKDKEKRHSAQTEVYYISDQIELLEDMEKEELFVIKAKNERLQAKLFLAEEKLTTVKVSYIDWKKIGESFMSLP
ncbi:hypothetical protein F2Q70_00009044 [Brassica cretica]|uniref:Uncharacterized protein n=2 Tax=Brassica cretica TaxID=69181 RepID=A0A8S9M0F5_BRACR|nr:hypothetical protein F2Q70_00009044 [Brassica cretica]